VSSTVDVEGRRPVDAAPHAAHEILAHARGMTVLCKLRVKPRKLESELVKSSW
jgi:hypothetical protein